jgi:hypothetical protein
MTPQETELVVQLFDRLANLENTPRDPEAERKIAEGLRRAPHALYALVQTALLQDEALKRANARIEELQAQEGAGEEPQQPASFLDSMRAAFGGNQPRGSVPSVRPTGYQAPPPYSPQAAPPGYGYGLAPGIGTGSSFLGTAASAAAGVVGGALLLDGIRSMFGHHGGAAPSAFGGLPASPDASPWGGSAADSDLAREAGIGDIGKNVGAEESPPADAPDDAYGPDDQTPFDDADFDTDDDNGGNGGSYDV